MALQTVESPTKSPKCKLRNLTDVALFHLPGNLVPLIRKQRPSVIRETGVQETCDTSRYNPALLLKIQ